MHRRLCADVSNAGRPSRPWPSVLPTPVRSGWPTEPGASEPAAPIEPSDLATLKALAQPRRRRMLEHLTLHGPATSATLARALGLNTGSASYHLRELARYGFVEETTEATVEEAAEETAAETPAQTAAQTGGGL